MCDMADNAGKIERLYRDLLLEFGPQGWWPLTWRSGEKGFDSRGYHPSAPIVKLRERDRFEISIGAILTQNTAWPNVEKALSRLSDRGITSAEEIDSCPDDILKEAIMPCGYFNQKAKKLKIACEFFLSGRFLVTGRPPSREELLGLWGIGPETADSILLYAFGLPKFVIDAYTRRIFSRLGILDPKTGYSGFQEAIISRLPLDPRLYSEYHALMVRFCKSYCASKPLCGGCPLKRRCGYPGTMTGK